MSPPHAVATMMLNTQYVIIYIVAMILMRYRAFIVSGLQRITSSLDFLEISRNEKRL